MEPNFLLYLFIDLLYDFVHEAQHTVRATIDRLVRFAIASTSSSASMGDVIAHAYKALHYNLTTLNVFPTPLNAEEWQEIVTSVAKMSPAL